VFFLLTSLTPTVSTANILNIRNRCSYPVWMWVVPQGIHSPDVERIPIPAYSTYSHNMEARSVSLKFRDLPYYEVAPAGIYQAEYKVVGDGSVIYYDSSLIDCNQHPDPTLPMYCPLASGGIRMYTSGDEAMCPVADCQLPGPCMNTYLTRGSWFGEPSFACPIQHDIFVEFCTVNDGQPSIDMYRYPDSGGRPLEDYPSTVRPQARPLPGPVIDPLSPKLPVIRPHSAKPCSFFDPESGITYTRLEDGNLINNIDEPGGPPRCKFDRLNPCVDNPSSPGIETNPESQPKDDANPPPRADGRCGENFGGATCDPKGNYGGCCSSWGWCGITSDHCLVAAGCQNGCKDAMTLWTTTATLNPTLSADKSTFASIPSPLLDGYKWGSGEFGSTAIGPTSQPTGLASSTPLESVQTSATPSRPTFDLGPNWYVVPAGRIVAIYDPSPRTTATRAPSHVPGRGVEVKEREQKLATMAFQA
jgi:hypothetical protein